MLKTFPKEYSLTDKPIDAIPRVIDALLAELQTLHLKVEAGNNLEEASQDVCEELANLIAETGPAEPAEDYSSLSPSLRRASEALRAYRANGVIPVVAQMRQGENCTVEILRGAK